MQTVPFVHCVFNKHYYSHITILTFKKALTYMYIHLTTLVIHVHVLQVHTMRFTIYHMVAILIGYGIIPNIVHMTPDTMNVVANLLNCKS